MSVCVRPFQTRLTRIQYNMRGSHYLNSSIPVYYWNVWDTFNYWSGSWMMNNDATMELGLNPSCWGDGGCYLASGVTDSKVVARVFLACPRGCIRAARALVCVCASSLLLKSCLRCTA